METHDKIIFVVESRSLGCVRERNDLEVGELEYNVTMWAISILINSISCKFLVDFENSTDRSVE